MKPEEGKQREGRANPKGIPCLYLADTKETAMSEMRGWLDAPITVSQFEIVRDVTVVDCTGDYVRVPVGIAFSDLDLETMQRTVWGTVSGAFSDPVNDGDDTADYAATQFVSDAFKQHGYHGVSYRSKVKKGGTSTAFFDPSVAIVRESFVYTVKSICYEFTEYRFDE